MTLRKYGIFSKPLAYSLQFSLKIILCCANLHNRSVNTNLRRGRTFEPPKHSSDVLCFNSVDGNIDRTVYYDNSDANVRNYMNNLQLDEMNEVQRDSMKKEFLLGHIYSSGIKFDLLATRGTPLPPAPPSP